MPPRSPRELTPEWTMSFLPTACRTHSWPNRHPCPPHRSRGPEPALISLQVSQPQALHAALWFSAATVRMGKPQQAATGCPESGRWQHGGCSGEGTGEPFASSAICSIIRGLPAAAFGRNSDVSPAQTPHPVPGYPCTARDSCQCNTPLALGRMRTDTQGNHFSQQWNIYSILNSKGGWEHLRCRCNIHINLVSVFQKEYKLHTFQYRLCTWEFLF